MVEGFRGLLALDCTLDLDPRLTRQPVPTISRSVLFKIQMFAERRVVFARSSAFNNLRRYI